MLVGSQPKLLTAEEFAELPDPGDGSQQELVRGVLATMPPPGFKHGLVCVRSVRRIGNFVDDRDLGHVTCNDAGVILERDPDTVRGPDVGYWSKERLPIPPEDGYPEIAPDLAVEVMSPHDVFQELYKKVREYLRAGTKQVWVFLPEDRSVGVFFPDGSEKLLHENDTIDGGDVLPGFSCRVGDFFPA